MAELTHTSLTGPGARTATSATLTASDTFTYQKGKGQLLMLNNVTAGALTPNLVGSAATTTSVPGYGSIDVSSGYSLSSVAAGEKVVVPLDSIYTFLVGGSVTLTGADGMEAVLLG